MGVLLAHQYQVAFDDPSGNDPARSTARRGSVLTVCY